MTNVIIALCSGLIFGSTLVAIMGIGSSIFALSVSVIGSVIIMITNLS